MSFSIVSTILLDWLRKWIIFWVKILFRCCRNSISVLRLTISCWIEESTAVRRNVIQYWAWWNLRLSTWFQIESQGTSLSYQWEKWRRFASRLKWESCPTHRQLPSTKSSQTLFRSWCPPRKNAKRLSRKKTREIKRGQLNIVQS